MKALAVVIASLAAATAPTPIADPALDRLDCPSLRVDFVQMLPETIEPQTFRPPDPPFSEDALNQLSRAEQFDPNGLCQYRDANRSQAPTTPDRAIFFGDSITEYWAIADRLMFSGEVLGRGVSAQKTGQMLLRFQQDVIQLKPRVVHIMAGINDAMKPGGATGVRSNIASMVELARAHGITVILGNLTPADSYWLAPGVKLSAFVAEHNRWLQAYASREKIALVDYHAALAGPDGRFLPGLSNDGLHPNRLGFARMGPLAGKALQAALGNRLRQPAR